MGKIKRSWIVIASIAVVLVIGFFAVQHFLDAETYHAQIETALSDSLGRRVELGHLAVSLLSGSVVAEGLSIADDPAFSNQPFVTAKDVRIGVEMMPLLLHRELHITGFTIDEPKITLLHAENGRWNYSSLGEEDKRKAPTAQTNSMLPNLTVRRIDIKSGVVTVGTLPQKEQPRLYTDLNVNVKNFSFTNTFPFSVNGKLPAGGSLALDGSAGPFNQRDASLTPFTAGVTLKHADLLGAGLVEPGQGISGIADLDAKTISNGRTLHADGKLHASQLKLAKNGTPSSQPVDLQFVVDQDLQQLSGKVNSANLQIGKAAFAVTGTYQTRGNATATNLNVNGQNMPINDLVAFLPSLGIQLPSGSRLQGGTLSTTLNVSGPVTAPVISGPVRIANTQLAGFDLGRKLASIQSFTGAKTGSNTTIQVLSTNLYYGPEGTRTDNLAAMVAGLGAASGNGTISPGGALNYHLVIKLSSTGIGGLAAQAMTLLPGVFGSAVNQATKDGIPVTIAGTTANPTFTPDMNKLVGGTNQQKKTTTNPLGDALKGLFQRH